MGADRATELFEKAHALFKEGFDPFSVNDKLIRDYNLEEKDLADQAYLRRMGYRARVEPPTDGAYCEIFKQQAYKRGWRRPGIRQVEGILL